MPQTYCFFTKAIIARIKAIGIKKMAKKNTLIILKINAQIPTALLWGLVKVTFISWLFDALSFVGSIFIPSFIYLLKSNF